MSEKLKRIMDVYNPKREVQYLHIHELFELTEYVTVACQFIAHLKGSGHIPRQFLAAFLRNK